MFGRHIQILSDIDYNFVSEHSGRSDAVGNFLVQM